jgi:hypothetical protein
MVGITEEPPRQLAPSVEKRRLDFVIWARSFFNTCGMIFIGSASNNALQIHLH